MYKPKPLMYSYDALQPYIDEETINIHYNKHYLGYLNKLNDLLNSIDYDYRYSVKELISKIEVFPIDKRDDILFLAGGVINHELYFDSMTPNNYFGGEIIDKIVLDYGSFENFKKEFIKNTEILVGSGYTNLVLNKNNKLQIINTSNQETPILYELIPIFNIDLWEHAYYLKYRNHKDLYVDAFFHIINFDTLNKNYEKAKQILFKK